MSALDYGIQAQILSEVEPCAVDWLIPGRVPLGSLSLLSGDPGLGKSLLTTSWAAGVTTGAYGSAPAGAMLLSAEDALAHTIRPRLEAAGADLDRVVSPIKEEDGLQLPLLLPDDLTGIGELVGELDVRLVVIDPVMAFLPQRVDPFRDQHVRLALTPLAHLAAHHRCAVVLVMHLNKGASTNPLHRIGGSMGLPGLARSVLLLARDPNGARDEDDRRVLAHVKCNLAPQAESLEYKIEPPSKDAAIPAPVIREAGPSSARAPDLLSVGPRPRGEAQAEAVAFLQDALAAGPLSALELRAMADELGIPHRTLDRAKRVLGAESRKTGGHGHGWEWHLPDARKPKDASVPTTVVDDMAFFQNRPASRPSSRPSLERSPTREVGELSRHDGSESSYADAELARLADKFGPRLGGSGE